jgi:uncharacterized membrane protein YjdF
LLIRRREVPILVVNLAYIVGFGALSVARLNYEFIIYTLVIVVFFVLVLLTQRRVEFSPFVLWGLTAWGVMHMAGGHVPIGAGRLYDVMLVTLSPRYQVIKYDQAVHLFGFGAATLVCYHLLRRRLGAGASAGAVLLSLVVLMGMGLGALNEVIELLVVLIVPASGVGGYFNTAFDLASNMLGALLAVGWILIQKKRQGAELPTV